MLITITLEGALSNYLVMKYFKLTYTTCFT
jgi:hypothetical protein